MLLLVEVSVGMLWSRGLRCRGGGGGVLVQLVMDGRGAWDQAREDIIELCNTSTIGKDPRDRLDETRRDATVKTVHYALFSSQIFIWKCTAFETSPSNLFGGGLSLIGLRNSGCTDWPRTLAVRVIGADAPFAELFSLFSSATMSSGVGTGLFVMKCVTEDEKKSSMRYVGSTCRVMSRGKQTNSHV